MSRSSPWLGREGCVGTLAPRYEVHRRSPSRATRSSSPSRSTSRSSTRRSTTPSARSPARCASPASGPARRPADPRGPARRRGRPRPGAARFAARVLRRRRATSTTSTSSPPRRSRSPPARRRARSPSTPSSRSGPASRCPATAASGSRCPARRPPTRRSTPRSTGCASSSPSWPRSTAPASDGDVVTIGIHGDATTASPSPACRPTTTPTGSAPARISAELDAQLIGAKVGDALAFDGDARRHRAHRHVQGARQEGAGAGAARGHRRVGQRGVGVRHRRGAPGRPRRPPGQRPQAAGLAWPCARRRSRPSSQLVEDEPPEPLVQQEMSHRLEDLVDAAVGPGHGRRAVPRRHRPQPGAAGRGAAGRRRPGGEGRPGPAGRRRRRGHRGHRRRPRRRDRARWPAGCGQKPEKVREQLDRNEQLPAVRSDLRTRKALEWLLEHVEIVDPEGQPIDRDAWSSSADDTTTIDAPRARTITTTTTTTITTTETTSTDDPGPATTWFPRWSSRPTAASGPTTSTAGCSRSGSSSSARRSTTRSPTWCAPSCCTSRPRTPTRRSTSTSTRRAATSPALFAIYDTMQYIKPEISTICFGQAASAAAVLLAAGAPGQAPGAAARPDPAAPAVGLRRRPGHRHRDPGP